MASVTVFLAGAECPFTCVFCDLWRHTLEGRTPEGALVRQLELALEGIGPVPAGARLKLYNASNFFDERAVPPADLEPLAELAAPFARVVVECHPRLVDDRCEDFAALLDCELEVAMGLECVHPGVLPLLNKQMSLEDWDRATTRLETAGIPFRAFVLIGAPFVAVEERADWAVVSAAYALESGAETVSLIPLRASTGVADLEEPSLDEIEEVFDRGLELGHGFAANGSRAVLLDTWDLERFARGVSCQQCRDARLARLSRATLSGVAEARVECRACAVA